MNRIHSLAKAIALLVAATGCSMAFAAGSTTLAVTASVAATCKFSATSTPLTFAAIDPSSLSNVTASANVLYKCTKGTASTGVGFATGSTARTMVGPLPADLLPYVLALAGGTQTGTGFGAGRDRTLAVTGTITPAQFQNATVGAYSENVTLNITP